MTAAHITTDTINEGDNTMTDTITRTPAAIFDDTFKEGDIIHFEGSSQPFAKIIEVRPGETTFLGADDLGGRATFFKDVQRVLPSSALSPWKHGRQPIRRRRWTDSERLQAIQLAGWGLTSQQIGEALDRTPHAVVCELQRLGFNMKVLRKARNMR